MEAMNGISSLTKKNNMTRIEQQHVTPLVMDLQKKANMHCVSIAQVYEKSQKAIGIGGSYASQSTSHYQGRCNKFQNDFDTLIH